MKRGGHKSERHRSEVKNSRFNSHIKSTYCDEFRNCQLHPVDPLIDPKSSSHGSVDVAFDELSFMLEKGGPRYALPLCARTEDRERESTPNPPGSPMGMPIR